MPTCPNCGTTFGEEHVCVRINNHDTEIVRTTGSMIDGSTSHEDLAEVFTANNSNNGENTIMPTNNTNNGENAMNTTIDLATLVAMVNNYKANHQSEVAQAVTDNSSYDGTTQSITSDVTVDGGIFAKTSKYYGQELCGFMYNPFMVSRFLPGQFKNLMDSYDRNVDLGIKTTVSLMDSIDFMIEECKRLSLMQKKSPIAFEERKQFWSVNDAREIFKDYLNKVQKNIDIAKDNVIRLERRLGSRIKYVKVFGKKYDVTFDVKIPEHGSARDAYTEVNIDWKYERVLKSVLAELNKCTSFEDLYKIMSFRRKKLVNLPSAYRKIYLGHGQWKTVTDNKMNTLSKVFLEGYKRKGAYYTIKDLIMFHDGEYKSLTGRDAVAYLRRRLDEGVKGYIFYAELKAMIDSMAR